MVRGGVSRHVARATQRDIIRKALGKLPELIRVRKTAKCQTYAVLCAQFYGKTIAELEEDWTSEPDGKRQKLLSDF